MESFKVIFSHMSSLRKPAWAISEALIWFKKKNPPQTKKQTNKTKQLARHGGTGLSVSEAEAEESLCKFKPRLIFSPNG